MSEAAAANRAALYLRLSHDDDGPGESESIQNQRSLLRRYAAQHGLSIVEEYVDDGWSGTRFDRPRFQAMLHDMERRRFHIVLVKDLSRLGRDYIQTGRYLELVFPEHGVRLIAVEDGIDTMRSDAGLAPFRNVINEMYARDLSRKIRSALRVKMQAGKFIGNFAPYGYQKDPADKNHLIPDARAAATVRQIFAWAAAGRRPAEIAHLLNARREPPPIVYRCQLHPSLEHTGRHAAQQAWSSAGVSRILQNEVYLGQIAQGKTDKISFKSKKAREKRAEEWIVVPDCHAPLVSRQIFDAVRHQRAARRCDRNGTFSNLFSGLAFCMDCGRAMSTVGTRRKGSAANLACGAYKQGGTAACSNHFIAYEALYGCVLDAVRQHVCLSEADRSALFQRLRRRLRLDDRAREAGRARERLVQEQQQVQRLLAQLYEDHAAERIGDANFYPLLARYERKTAALRQQLDALPSTAGESALQQQQERLRAIIGRYTDVQELTPPLLFELIGRIEVGQGSYDRRDGRRVKRQRIVVHFRFLSEPHAIDWTE